MSKKTALSEEQLDMISGGVFTFQGKEVTQFEKINDFGVQLATKDGSMFFPWNDHARETFGSTFFGTDYLKAMGESKKYKAMGDTGAARNTRS